jgi:hypothetical protein
MALSSVEPVDFWECRLGLLPCEVLQNLLSKLGIKELCCLGKTCKDARYLFWNYVSINAFDGIDPNFLKQRIFSFETESSRFAEIEHFVFNILQIDGSIHVSKWMLEIPAVAKSEAVAKLIFRKTITPEIGTALKNVGAEPFLNSLKALPQYPLHDDWKEYGLGALFRCDNNLLKSDREVVLSFLEYCFRNRESQSSFSSNREWTVVPTFLKNTKPGLLKDKKIILAMLKIDFQGASQILQGRVLKPFWKSKRFVTAAVAQAHCRDASWNKEVTFIGDKNIYRNC